MTRMISISTGCSGIEAPLQALEKLKVPYKQLWRCEIDKYANLSADANYPAPKMKFNDITKRDHSKLPHVDLYVCGFPCQSFSSMGKNLGLSDPRARVIQHMVATIHSSKPKMIILENVKQFRTIHDGKAYNLLMSILEKDYHMAVDVYKTIEHGLPQTRERLYFVGIRKGYQKKPYVKPKPVKMMPLDKIIDKSDKSRKPFYIDTRGYAIRKDVKYNVLNTAFSGNKSIKYDVVPTLIANSAPPYIYELGRFLNVSELLKLQGFNPQFKRVVSNSQLVKQLGNSMSCSVLVSIVKELFSCTKGF